MALEKNKSKVRIHAMGFSLIELMIAMLVLAFGLVAGAAVISTAIATNGRARFDTTATALAESVMEHIVAIPSRAQGAAALTSMTDCAGTTFPMNTVQGGAPLVTAGPFAGNVDFLQPAVQQYSMLYTICSAGRNMSYDVRWRIDAGPTPFTQLVTVSAKSVGQAGNSANGNRFALPVRLRTIRGTF